MPRCYISLGANLGDVVATFDRSLERLADSPGMEIVAVSRYHQTAPIGDQAGAEFLNAAAAIETSLSPEALLDRLQSIESELGRARTIRWGPRTLDLDLVFYGSRIIESPRLTVPHPAAWYRRFVLAPLVEIAPHVVHPERLADVQTLQDRLLVRPLPIELAGGAAELRQRLVSALKPEFSGVTFREHQPAHTTGPGAHDATVTFWLGAPERSADHSPLQFEHLPVISRLDLTRSSEPAESFIRAVLQSALR